MKKTYFYLTLILLFFTLFANAQVVENTDTTDIGVEINGVIWATRNVDMPKKFAANPYDIGMLYQYNRNLGWSSTDPMVASDGSTTWNTAYSFSQFWQPENDPCPNGWRVPSPAEFQLLVDAGESYFINDYHFNGGDCKGRIFGDYFHNNYIFLRSYSARGNWGQLGIISQMLAAVQPYWSSTLKEITQEEIAFAYILVLGSSSPDNYTRFAVSYMYGISGEPVRCVKKEITEERVIGITLNKTSTTLSVNTIEEQLIASILPANATNQNISWISSNTDIVDVLNGRISPVSIGIATITVTTQDGGYTATCEVTVTDNDADVKEISDNNLVKIFPNPANDEFKIESGVLKINNIEITDILGKLFLSCLFTKDTISITDLPQGIYLLKINTNKGLIIKKFIKK